MRANSRHRGSPSEVMTEISRTSVPLIITFRADEEFEIDRSVFGGCHEDFSPCVSRSADRCRSTSGDRSVMGPVYPAPGGNSFSGSGNNDVAGGATWTYGSFDTSAYGQLWWAETNVSNICSPIGCNAGTMSFAGYDQTTGVAT